MIAIWREFDAERLNEVVNHPSVHDWVSYGRPGPLDTSPVVNDPRNVLLMGEHGGYLFAYVEDGVYDAHSQILPEGRGKWSLELARAALAWMFEDIGAKAILAHCPVDNVAVLALTKRLGFKWRVKLPAGHTAHGTMREVPENVYELTRDDWSKTQG